MTGRPLMVGIGAGRRAARARQRRPRARGRRASPSTRARFSPATCSSPSRAKRATAMTSCATAFEKGAAAAVIDEAHASELAGAGPLFVVKDVQQSLESLGQRARERTAAFIAAITGSVGKTSTKDMTRLMLSRFGDTHASAASYNNHWGVPLTLARMPAKSRFGVFELGMNHAGEIAALVAQVRPHVAVVTRIAPVHLEYFGSIEDIADAKAEIFSGLDGGVAIINRDDGFYERLAAAAAPTRRPCLQFRRNRRRRCAAPVSTSRSAKARLVEAEILERRLRFRIGAPGRHVAVNALAALLVGAVFDVDLEEAAVASSPISSRRQDGAGARRSSTRRRRLHADRRKLQRQSDLDARGAGAAWRRADGPGGRRIAVLGDMLELGPQAAELHAALGPGPYRRPRSICYSPSGPLMSRLSYAAPDAMRAAHRADAAGTGRGRSRRRSARRRRDGQRLQRFADVADRRGLEKPRSPPRWRAKEETMLTLLADFSYLYSPLNVFRYITFRAAMAAATALFFVFFFGPGDHLGAAHQAGQGPADPRGRACVASRDQERHADDGRPDDPVGSGRCDAALGEFAQLLCVDRALRHGRLRPHRLLRRLSQGDEAVACGLFRQAATGAGIRDRRPRLLRADA